MADGKKDDWAIGCGCLVLLSFLLWGTTGLAVWLWPDSKWLNELWYSFDRDLKDATVIMNPQPHDCEFLTAPLGSKHCYYKKNVATVRIRTNGSGLREVSTDEGITWKNAGASDRATIIIWWERVQE